MPNISPKQKGLNTELHCISYFSDCGFLVSTPYGDNGRYDLIVDVNGHLLRVQVKTASLKEDGNGIKFSGKSARINTKESYVKRYTKDEIDYFATFWNNQVYVIPVEEVSSEKTLRFYSTQNNQDYLISFLEDYTIQKQWSKYLDNNEIIIEPEKETIVLEYKKNNPPTIKINKCKRCGVEIKKESQYCAECYNFLQRRVERPNRETLKKLIRTKTFVSIGQKYNVSDKTISKWCKAANLPDTKAKIKSYSDSDWEQI